MMNYFELREMGMPIGSGAVEAACKTLVAQRMKQSGMRWGMRGGQAILTIRGWTQSERFDHAWAILAAKHRVEVTVLDNVRAFPSRKTRAGYVSLRVTPCRLCGSPATTSIRLENDSRSPIALEGAPEMRQTALHERPLAVAQIWRTPWHARACVGRARMQSRRRNR